MKKFALIIAFALMLMMPNVSSAQLAVKKKVEKIEKLCSVRTGLIHLNRMGKVYYIAATTQYSEGFIFFLGDDRTSALLTLQDLYDLFDMDVKESVEVDNRGKDCHIMRTTGNTILFSQEGIAGGFGLLKSEVNKFIEVVSDLYD